MVETARACCATIKSTGAPLPALSKCKEAQTGTFGLKRG
jgi:hypothetical protein